MHKRKCKKKKMFQKHFHLKNENVNLSVSFLLSITMVKYKIFLIFIIEFFIKISTQQPDALLPYEQQLQKINDDSIKFELSLVKTLRNLNAYVRVSNLNLKASKIASSLCNVFDSTLITISRLMTIKNFEIFSTLSYYSTCDYINIRTGFLDLDMRKTHSIISEIESNLTMLNENINGITFNYGINLRDLLMNWTKERSVVNILKQLWVTLTGYRNYVGLLKNNLNYFGDLNTYLSEYPVNYSNISSNSTFQDVGNKIEEKLANCQEDLVNAQKLLDQKIEAALLTVSFGSIPILKAGTTPSNQKLVMQKMKNNVKKFSTAKDFKKSPQVAWPRIPDSGGASSGATSRMTLKVRAAQSKKRHYGRSYANHLKNQTCLRSDKNDLNSARQSGRRRKRATDPLIDEILNLTSIIEEKYSTCMQAINSSIEEVNNLLTDVVYPCGESFKKIYLLTF